MKLGEIYELAVRLGVQADPRGEEAVRRVLAEDQKKYNEMKEKERQEFDLERLANPYSDSRILNGEKDREVNSILAGIDIEVGEVLLADRLRERGQAVDLLLAHHPEGKALAALHDVMHVQEDILAELGVPINVAEGIMAPRIGEVHRGLMPLNHDRTVDAARLLDIPLMCIHTPADNLVTGYLQDLLEKRNPSTVGELMDTLKEIPEYARAMEINAGPQVVVGSKDRRVGKVFVDMTGGTSGSEDAYAKLVQAGVGTIVTMHISDKHRKEAEKNHINVVIAGHIASDSLGMNLLLDQIAKQGVQVKTCSGLYRVNRE
ncbi:NGG1p interacting factor 3 protein, NIF3 [Clostridiales bacterium PH28_bin88]|nr:NGG1p interacting factor 3 protein, NIF3 [Clostridiales bacterium PH28_bin88]